MLYMKMVLALKRVLSFLMDSSYFSFQLYLKLFVYAHTCICECGSQRTVCGSWFFPSTMWIPRIKLNLSGLVVSILTYRDILQVHGFET